MLSKQRGFIKMKINFDKSKKFRRFIILWVMSLITVFLVWSWILPPNIPEHTAKVILGILGLLTVVIAFYQWLRSKDEEVK